jgi:hypothetical protein
MPRRDLFCCVAGVAGELSWLEAGGCGASSRGGDVLAQLLRAIATIEADATTAATDGQGESATDNR